nr:hypothetical protein DGKKSRWO_DGKKSRWO_CDS_0068 [uncultured phage]CAI9752232.1 hypothetical protein CVNMHQAP_CVNMHQAP_CDS_0068 [uncultured phage]
MMYKQNLTIEEVKYKCKEYSDSFAELFNTIINTPSMFKTCCEAMQLILNEIIYHTYTNNRKLTLKQLVNWFFIPDDVDVTDDYEQFVLKLIENYDYCVEDAMILVLNNQKHKISEFADSRQKIVADCTSLGKQFAHHFNKIMDEGVESPYFSHHCDELRNYFNQVSSVKFKHNNKRLTIENLIDWFFTTGQNIEDVVKEQYVDAYDKLITYLVANRDNFNIEEIMTKLCKEFK